MTDAFALLFFVLVAAAPVALRADVTANPEGDGSAPLALVDETLSFLKRYALTAPDEKSLLRAGVVRLCTEQMDRPGCYRPDLDGPKTTHSGPDRVRAWRGVLESVVAAEKRLRGDKFDALALERYVMDAMVSALNDAQSFYIAPAVYRKITSIPGDFIGFGFAPRSEPAGLRVAAVYKDSPACETGLRSGDLITFVNGQSVGGYRRSMALAAIWGADGERIALTAKRGAAERSFEIVYRPWTFKPYTVTASGGVATAQISHLTDGLTSAVARAISESNAGGLILDMRQAVTGSQGEALRLGDLLLPEADFGMRRSADTLTQRRWKTKGASPGENLAVPVVVILSENTAGWAELLAGALGHHQRALVIGQKSAGRPEIQLIRPFSDGSAVQVTSSRLCGPSDVELTTGVRPHVELSVNDPLALARTTLKTSAGGDFSTLLASAQKLIVESDKPSLDSDR